MSSISDVMGGAEPRGSTPGGDQQKMPPHDGQVIEQLMQVDPEHLIVRVRAGVQEAGLTSIELGELTFTSRSKGLDEGMLYLSLRRNRHSLLSVDMMQGRSFARTSQLHKHKHTERPV